MTIQWHDLALVHDRGNLERGVLTTLRQHPLAHLEDAYGGDKEGAGVLDGGGVHIRVRAVGKIFEPAAGIDEVHTRSSSRSTVVSIPLRNPRKSCGFLIGISSIRFS